MGRFGYQMGLGSNAFGSPFQDSPQSRFNPLAPPQQPPEGGGVSIPPGEPPPPQMPPNFNPLLPPQGVQTGFANPNFRRGLGGGGGIGQGGMTGNPWGPMQPMPQQNPGGLGLGALGPMPGQNVGGGQDYGSAFRWGGNNGLAQAIAGMTNPSGPASGFGAPGAAPGMLGGYMPGPGQMQPRMGLRGMGPTLGQMNNFTNRSGRFPAY